MHPSSRHHASAGWSLLALFAALLAALLARPCKAARMFIIDSVSATAGPSLPWPSGPVGLTGRFDGAVQVASLGGTPAKFVWDIVCSPAVVAYVQAHVPATAFLGAKYSDLRLLAATRPALIAAIFRKLVQRTVTVNGQSVTVRLLVPKSSAVAGDVTVQAEVPANRFFGILTGED